MKLTKEDREYLWNILNISHNWDNGTDILECPMDNCWYKAILKKLKIKEPKSGRTCKKTKRDKTSSRRIRR